MAGKKRSNNEKNEKNSKKKKLEKEKRVVEKPQVENSAALLTLEKHLSLPVVEAIISSLGSEILLKLSCFKKPVLLKGRKYYNCPFCKGSFRNGIHLAICLQNIVVQHLPEMQTNGNILHEKIEEARNNAFTVNIPKDCLHACFLCDTGYVDKDKAVQCTESCLSKYFFEKGNQIAPPTDFSLAMHYCRTCHETFSGYQYMVHSITCCLETWFCFRCEKRFAFYDDLKKHAFVCHGAVYKCACDKSHGSFDNFKECLLSHDSPLRRKCKQCGELFQNARAINDHLMFHHGNSARHLVRETFADKSGPGKFVRCKVCKGKFQNLAKYSYHFAKDCEKSYLSHCKLCEFKSEAPKDIAKHMANEHLKFGGCTLCGLFFYSFEDLMFHLKFAHEAKYDCLFCQESGFKNYSEMYVHMENEHLKCSLCKINMSLFDFEYHLQTCGKSSCVARECDRKLTTSFPSYESFKHEVESKETQQSSSSSLSVEDDQVPCCSKSLQKENHSALVEKQNDKSGGDDDKAIESQQSSSSSLPVEDNELPSCSKSLPKEKLSQPLEKQNEKSGGDDDKEKESQQSFSSSLLPVEDNEQPCFSTSLPKEKLSEPLEKQNEKSTGDDDKGKVENLLPIPVKNLANAIKNAAQNKEEILLCIKKEDEEEKGKLADDDEWDKLIIVEEIGLNEENCLLPENESSLENVCSTNGEMDYSELPTVNSKVTVEYEINPTPGLGPEDKAATMCPFCILVFETPYAYFLHFEKCESLPDQLKLAAQGSLDRFVQYCNESTIVKTKTSVALYRVSMDLIYSGFTFLIPYGPISIDNGC